MAPERSKALPGAVLPGAEADCYTAVLPRQRSKERAGARNGSATAVENDTALENDEDRARVRA